MMARGLDGLVEFLLGQVALCGEKGATAADFKNFIDTFYAKPDENNHDTDAHFLPVNTDRRFREKVWKWLTAHPDIWVGQKKEGNKLSLTEYEDLKNEAPKIFVTQERMWHEVAGHGPDSKRIPPMEFVILSLVASAGEQGITQPDVTRLSGQDKRSVPKRTDRLVDNGYIVKTAVLSRGTRTSLLIHKRFLKSDPQGDVKIEHTSAPNVIYNYIFVNHLLRYEQFFDTLMGMLRDNGVMSMEDVRFNLGVMGKKWEQKAIWRCLRRMEGIGFIQRVKAHRPGHDWCRSLKFVREPTEAERNYFITLSRKAKAEDPVAEEDSDEEMPDDAAPKQGEVDDTVEEIKRLPPQWDPDRPLSNFVFDFINHTGVAGATFSFLRKRGVGTFYRRPIENFVSRLTDVWHVSQPQNVRHLSIIRDTAIAGKYVHFVFRTYDNFDLAVQSDDAAWEAVIAEPKNTTRADKTKSHRKHAPLHFDTIEELDEWGFRKLDPAKFTGGDGCATIAACANASKPKIFNPYEYKPAGNGVNGMFQHNGKMPTRKRLNRILPKETESSGPQYGTEGILGQDDTAVKKPEAVRKPYTRRNLDKPLGRPRKYPKGLEPYNNNRVKKENRIRMEAENIALAEILGISQEALAAQLEADDVPVTAQADADADAPQVADGNSASVTPSQAGEVPAGTQSSGVAEGSAEPGQEPPLESGLTKKGKPRTASKRESKLKPSIKASLKKALARTEKIKAMNIDHKLLGERSQELYDKRMKEEEKEKEEREKEKEDKAKEKAKNDQARHFEENGELRKGAHVDPPGQAYENPEPKKMGRVKKSTVLVVKSERLKTIDLDAKAPAGPEASVDHNATARQSTSNGVQMGDGAVQIVESQQTTEPDIWSSHFSRVAAIDRIDIDSPEDQARPATPVDDTRLNPIPDAGTMEIDVPDKQTRSASHIDDTRANAVTDAGGMDVDSPEKRAAPVTVTDDVQRALSLERQTGPVSATYKVQQAPSTPPRDGNLPSTAVANTRETQAAAGPGRTPTAQDSFPPINFSPTPLRFSPIPVRLSVTPPVTYAPLPPSAFGRTEFPAASAGERPLLPRPSATPIPHLGQGATPLSALAPRPLSASGSTPGGQRPEENAPAATPLNAPFTPTPVTLPRKRGRPPKDPSQKAPRRTKKAKTAADAELGQSATTPAQPNGQSLATISSESMAAAPTVATPATAEKPPPKKRGRKPKNQTSSGPVTGAASMNTSSAGITQPSMGVFSLVIGKAVETVPTGTAAEDPTPIRTESGSVATPKAIKTPASVQSLPRHLIAQDQRDPINVSGASNSKDAAPTTEASTTIESTAASETLPTPGPMLPEDDSDMTDDVDYSSLQQAQSSVKTPRAVAPARESPSGPAHTQDPAAGTVSTPAPQIPASLPIQQHSSNPQSQRRNSQAASSIKPPIHAPPRGYFNDRSRLTAMRPPPTTPYISPYAPAPARRALEAGHSLQTPPDTARKSLRPVQSEVAASAAKDIFERRRRTPGVERALLGTVEKTDQPVQPVSEGILTNGVAARPEGRQHFGDTPSESARMTSHPLQSADSGTPTDGIVEKPGTTFIVENFPQPDASPQMDDFVVDALVADGPAAEQLPTPYQTRKSRGNLATTGKRTNKRKQPPVSEEIEESAGPRLEKPVPSSRAVSTTAQSPPGSMTTKRRKTTDVDQTNPDESAAGDLDSLPAHQLPFVSIDKQPKKPKTQRKQGVRISSGGVLRFHRTRVLINILKQCDGVFPGNSEIEKPFNFFWLKDHPKDKTVDRDTIRKSVKIAVDAGNIRRLTFTFKRSNGVVVSKQIITLPSVEPTSPVVLELQKQMIKAFPKYYFPPQMSVYEDFDAPLPRPRGAPSGSYVGLYKKDESAILQKQFLPLWMQQVHRPELWAPDDTVTKRTLERRQRIMLGQVVSGRYRHSRFPLHPEEDEDYGPWLEGQLNYNIDFPGGQAPLIVDDPSFTYEGCLGEFWTSYFSIDLTSDDEMIEDEVEQLRALTKGEIPKRISSQPILSRPGPSRLVPKPEASLVFHNSHPSTFDPDYEKQWITSLTDPDVNFHRPTGTFSTNYYVQRNARLSLWVQPDPQQQTEDSLPWTLHQMLGEVKIPGVRRNHDLRQDVQYSKFEEQLVQVGYWERMNFKDDKDATPSRARRPHFINHSPLVEQDSAVAGTMVVSWDADESTMYTPEVPPPSVESDESEVDRPVRFKRRRGQGGVVLPSATTARAMRPPPAKANVPRPRRRTGQTDAATAHTLPSDTVMEDAAENGYVTTAAKKPAKKKKLKGPTTQDPRCVIDAVATQKFLYAMVVTRSLIGGIHRETNWVIIENKIFHDFPYFCRVAFRNRWSWMKKNSPDVLKKLDEEFQRVYLLAYECGDVPPINYKDLENYDWAGVVEWARQNIVIKKPEVYNGELPSTRGTLDRTFTLEPTGQHRFWNKDHIFRENSLSINRIDSTHNFPFHAPLDVPDPLPQSAIVYERVKSWARAIVMSPADKYNDKEAKQKIQRVDPALLEQAMEDLCDTVCFRKVKHGRIMPGRNFVIGERLTQTFYLHATETQLLDAVKYKHHIDTIFQQTGNAPIQLSTMASEGEILAITNLLAKGYIRTVDSLPPIANKEAAPFPKISQWGFTEGHYKTVKLDRQHLRWDLHFSPTDAYVFGNPLQPSDSQGTRPPPVPAPGSLEEGMIPFWYDIHGNFLYAWWLKLVASVLHVLMSRPGAVPEVVCRSLKNVVAAWEVRLLMGWLRDVGAVERMAGVGAGWDGEEPLVLADWWWMVTDCKVCVR